ncbi:MAG TPA: hypothetical protein VD908_13290 [Cytophagales bacterium]|nr:hypothetical protein [Cytophagales bacterium]
MGYLPAIFVILGGCFLWGIVVQNTLKTQRELLKSKLEKLKDAAMERNRVLQALFNELPPLELDSINQEFLVKAQSIPYDLERFFMPDEVKAHFWTEKILKVLQLKGYGEDRIKVLSEASLSVKMRIKEFVKSAGSYNKLISSKPTSFMASFLKFQEIPL